MMVDSTRCPRCNGTEFYTTDSPPHVGLWCSTCNRLIKWLSQGRPLEVMPFGAHSGSPITSLPWSYLNWTLENLELRGSLLKALEAEFERRGRTE
jgi:hypothetical protein